MSTTTQRRRTRTAASIGGRTFVLSFPEVAQLLNQVTLAEFIVRLADAIAGTYNEDDLESITRTGWPRPPDTLEVMGCQAADYTCVKLISSNPSLTGRTVPIVAGTLVCTENVTDQARLVCDAGILTPLRTAASTAVVMRDYVPDVASIGIIGSGREGTSHAFVLSALLKQVRSVRLYDLIPGRAQAAAHELADLLNRPDIKKLVQGRKISVEPLDAAHRNLVFDCDALVTATYGQPAIVTPTEAEQIPGHFIAAIGADLEGKQELETAVYDHAKFIADDLVQCMHDGELQRAAPRLRQKIPEPSKGSHGGSLFAGRFMSVAKLLEDPQPFRNKPEELTVYDSTGFSGQDLALARVLLRFLEAERWESRAWNPQETPSLVSLLDRYK